MKYWKSFMEYCKILHKRFFYKVLKKNCLVHIFFFGMLFPYSGFWVSWNTTRGKGNHLCSIGIITRGLRPLVIIPILHSWLPLPLVVFHDTQNPLYGNLPILLSLIYSLLSNVTYWLTLEPVFLVLRVWLLLVSEWRVTKWIFFLI